MPAIVLVLLLCFPFSSFFPHVNKGINCVLGRRVLGRLIFEYVLIEQDPGRYLGRLSIDLDMKKSGEGDGMGKWLFLSQPSGVRIYDFHRVYL